MVRTGDAATKVATSLMSRHGALASCPCPFKLTNCIKEDVQVQEFHMGVQPWVLLKHQSEHSEEKKYDLRSTLVPHELPIGNHVKS